MHEPEVPERICGTYCNLQVSCKQDATEIMKISVYYYYYYYYHHLF
jgi:hypothetical protein